MLTHCKNLDCYIRIRITCKTLSDSKALKWTLIAGSLANKAMQENNSQNII